MHALATAPFLALALCLAPAPAHARTRQAGPDLPQPQVAAGDDLRAPVVADLDGDGRQDVVLVDKARDQLLVSLARPGGRLRAPARYATGPRPVDVAVADVDSDGVLDVLVAHQEGGGVPSGVQAFLGTPGGGLAPPVTRTLSGMRAGRILVGDLDRDGHLDFVATPEAVGLPHACLGLGDGAFGAPIPIGDSGSAARVASLGDLDGDPFPDLVIPRPFQPNGVQLWHGVGDGSFVSGGVVTSGLNLSSARLADLDGDGDDDLVTRPFFATAFAHLTRVQLASAPGVFGTPTVVPGAGDWAFDLADVDRDGRLDLAYAATAEPGERAGALKVHYGDGAGGFGPPTSIAVGCGGSRFASNFLGRPRLLSFAFGELDSGPGLDLVLVHPVLDPEDPLFDPADVGRLGYQRNLGGRRFEQHLALGGPDFAGQRLAVADLDGDGADDTVVAGVTAAGAGALGVRFGDGAGGLGAPSAVDLGAPAPFAAGAVAAGDLDGDPWPDVVVASGPGELRVLNGQPGGLPGAPQVFLAGTNDALALDDWGAGPEDEVAVYDVDPALGPVVRFLGLQSGALVERGVLPGGFGDRIRGGDLDGDGSSDLVLDGSASVPVLRVHLRTGDFAFGPGAAQLLDGDPIDFVVADLDGDARPEIVVCVDALAGRGGFRVLWNRGDGTFDPAVAFDAAGPTVALAVFDADGDGRQDVVAAGCGTLAFQLGRPGRVLDGPLVFGARRVPRELAVLRAPGLLPRPTYVAEHEPTDPRELFLVQPRTPLPAARAPRANGSR